MVELTNEISDIEKSLKKEIQLKHKLQDKLSLKIKREREKTKKEKAQKKRISQQKITREKRLETIAKAKLGKRYVWGAVGPRTFDCSGFTSYSYKKMGIAIPRTSIRQAEYGEYIKRDSLSAGDLIFFLILQRQEKVL
ncbi:MAG: C40 family peptidase [Sulfurovum sp.]|nr:C40 family peptidase [Sulfurovum sp.]